MEFVNDLSFSIYIRGSSGCSTFFFLVIDSRKKQPREAVSATIAGPSTGTTSTSLFHEDRMTAKGKFTGGAAARPQNRLRQAQLRELEAEKEREA